MFVINFKNYDEIATSTKSTRLTKSAAKIAKKHGVKIVVCPPQHMMSEMTHVSANVFAQHLDSSKAGSTTGFVVPEIVKKSRVAGSLINHSEHRIPSNEIEDMVNRLRELGMTSIVCVQDVNEAWMYSKFNPDYIAIEPPELIGSGKAVSKEKPEVITEAVKAVKNANNSTQLLCGAGIVSGEDVHQALKLGAKGILVASGIVKATDWEKAIEEFALAFTKK
ncbi:MAG: triose-phosphate isomerase [Thaumarchaeota archaeon]|nr:triose-phosphate isomerase [Nitrososphaerota archaeon]